VSGGFSRFALAQLGGDGLGCHLVAFLREVQSIPDQRLNHSRCFADINGLLRHARGMSDEPKKITRQELYDAVWKTPLTKLATEWNTTSAELVKRCDELNVPRPDPGHWQRIKHGWDMMPTYLPPADASTSNDIVLGRRSPRLPKSQEDPAIPETLTPSAPTITVPEDLRSAHPLVRRQRQAMDKASLDKGAVCMGYREAIFNMSVSRTQQPRALRILDALVKALEQRGCSFKKADESENQTLVVGEDNVAFRLAEEIRKEKDEAASERSKARGDYFWEKWNYVQTGKLRFSILEHWPVGGRRNWGDCDRYQLEEKLGEIIEWIFKSADGVKANRLHWEEQRRKWHEAEQRR
jgi:hypothetical protein